MKQLIADEIWIEEAEIDTPIARTVLSRAGDRPIHVLATGRSAPPPGGFAAGKRRLVLQRHRGTFLQRCRAGTAGLVCCNYMAVNLASNCPLDCSYCFLQEYLASNPALKAFTNVDEALGEVDAALRARPDRTFRIGTGELADSLALDPLTALTRHLVPFFAARRNAVLELKTKTDCVEELLDMDPRGRVVVSWSVNAAAIIDGEEHGTAPLAARLAAARRVQAAGYRLGFHFDPLVEFDGWEEAYRDAVATVFSAVDPHSVAWVSLGSLRLTPALAKMIRARGPTPYVTAGELVTGADGKARVWRGLRIRMYRALLARLRAAAPDLPVYLCMEPPPVWDRLMRQIPAAREVAVQDAG